MAISIVSNAIIVNNTTTQNINYSANHTAGSGSNKAYVIFSYGYKDTFANDLTTDFTVSLNGTAISNTKRLISQSTTVAEWSCVHVIENPPSGSNTLSFSSAFLMRAFAAIIVECSGVDQVASIIEMLSTRTASNISTQTFTHASNTSAGMYLAGLCLRLPAAVSEITVSNGGTSLLIANTTGGVSSSDLTFAASYEQASVNNANGHTFNWITAARSCISSVFLKESTNNGINNSYIGSSLVSSYYIGNTAVDKLILSSNTFYQKA